MTLQPNKTILEQVRMKPVLTFFFDALKPESLEYMPFLNSFAYKKRMRAELGHSVTCHPSMYSGVHPNKHLQWFVWKYDPVSTPFKWARVFKYLGLFDNVGSRYFLHKYTRMLIDREGQDLAVLGVNYCVEPAQYTSSCVKAWLQCLAISATRTPGRIISTPALVIW
jgi:hypothetical protein